MHSGTIVQHRYNQEIGQFLYDTCQKCGFTQALPAALSVWLLSSALYGGYILLMDPKNQYQRELQQVTALFRQHRKFIFTNRVIWQPARFLIQIWTLFPTFTKGICRLPGINTLLRYLLAQKLKSAR